MLDEKIEILVKKINSHSICVFCGGDIKSGECEACGNIDKDSKDAIMDLELYIPMIEKQQNFNLKKVLNYLTIISEFEIDSVNHILKKYDYINIFNNNYINVKNKINNNKEIDENDLNVLECKILSPKIDNDISLIFNCCTQKAILKEKNISYEAYKELMRKFVLNAMSHFVVNPKCFIQDEFSKGVGGEHLYNRIYLNEEHVKKIYYKSETQIIHIFLHELRHAIQHKLIEDGYVSEEILDQIKDQILSENNREYYKKNYYNLSYEKDAEYYSIIAYTDYIKSLGFNSKDDYLENKKRKLIENFNNKDRIVNNKVITLDDAFNEYILNNPNKLKKYSQLNIFYKIEDNKVFLKTNEEILEYLKEKIQTSNKSDKNIESYKYFYEEILSLNKQL